MTSEIKVDTISEQTSANGVTIDGLTIKDGNIIGDVALAGTTPTFTIGDAGAEDAALIFDGNAQDFYVALDDSADDLVIGLGNTIGTTPIMSFDENKDVVIHDGGLSITTADNTDTLTLVSTDTDSAIGPNLNLYRNAGNGADADNLATVAFAGNDDAGNATDYFRITAQIDDASNGSEDVYVDFRTLVAGSERKRISLLQAETVFNEESADLDFRVESNGNTHQLFVDGGNDRVYVGAGSGSGVGSNRFQVQNGGATISSFANDSGSNQLHFIKSRNTTVGSQTIVADGDSVGGIFWKADDGDATDYNNNVAGIEGVVDGTPGTNDTPGRLVFYTTNDGERTNTERLRIASTGQTTLTSSINDVLFYVKNTQTSGNVFGQQINFSSTVNDTGSYFFRCVGNNNSTVRAVIFANGDFDSATNSYGATSDERIKQNITDANSQWDDIKALKVRNFKLKDEARTETGGGQAAKTYLGLVAQETETVSPGLVKLRDPEKADILSSSEFGTLYEDGDDIPEGKAIGDIKTTTNEKVKSVSYSVLYMKAIKALQEAMTRIETLEAEVTALKG